MKTRAGLLVALGAAVWTATSGPAGAQPTSRWPSPQPDYTLDFGREDSGRRVAFHAEGAALEIALDFLLIKHPRVTVRARLPEAGRFDVEQVNPRAVVDVVRKGPDRFELSAKLLPVSRTDAAGQARARLGQLAKPYQERLRPQADKMSKRELAQFLQARQGSVPTAKNQKQALKAARQAYVDLRALEEMAPELREKLKEIASGRPVWVPAKDQLLWSHATPGELRDDFLRLSEYEIMDEHLQRCGLGFDSNVIGFQRKLESRFGALYLVLAGKVGEDPDQSAKISQALGLEDRSKLRDCVTVQLRCRFFPDVDPEDPNGQWFNAQRVACRAGGVASIRVLGSLNPAGHDRARWGTLGSHLRY